MSGWAEVIGTALRLRIRDFGVGRSGAVPSPGSDLSNAKALFQTGWALLPSAPVSSVNDKTGAVVLVPGDIGSPPNSRTVNGSPLSADVTIYSQSAYAQAGTSGGAGELWYYANQSGVNALQIDVVVANVLRAMPFVAPARGGTLDRIAFSVTTLSSGNARIGLYTNTSDSDLYPATLLADSGSISTGTAGVKSASITQALTPGRMYWLAFVSDTTPSIRKLNGASTGNLMGNPPSFAVNPNVGLTVNFTYASLPGTFPAGAVPFNSTSAPVPALGYRFSS